jgi:predicted amidohydrolase
MVGVEDNLQFWGGSRLIGPTGDLLAIAKYDQEDLVVCDLNYNDIRTAEPSIPTLRDLRAELFDELKRESEQF